MTWIPTLVFVGFLVTAAVTDVRTQRIPNRLVVAGLIVGLLTRTFAGWAALGSGLLAALVGLVLGMGLFALGAMGAGDGKLLAAVGAFMGLQGGAAALLASAIVGGILAMALAMRRGVIVPVLLNTRDLGIWLLTFGRRGERVQLSSEGAVAFPFGVAIAIGSLCAWFGLITV